MDNIKLISTYKHRPMTDGITCTDTVDADLTYYEVVNPHWIANLDARGVEGMKSLRFNINMRQCCPELDHHDAIQSVRRKNGKYIIEAVDL